MLRVIYNIEIPSKMFLFTNYILDTFFVKLLISCLHSMMSLSHTVDDHI